MKTTLTIALIASLSFAASAQHAPFETEVAKQAGLPVGTPYILYLGDVHGTPFEVLSVGQVPAAGERRIRLPEFRGDEVGMFLEVEGCTYQVAKARDLALDDIRPSDMAKKGQWVAGRIKPVIVAQAPSPTLGGNHDVFSPDPPVDEQPPFTTDMDKKNQWVIGRIKQDMISDASAVGGAVLGSATPKLGMADQAHDLGLHGDTGSSHVEDSGVIECPWGGPDVFVQMAATTAAAPASVGTNNGASLGGSGSMSNGDQGLDTNTQVHQRRSDVRRGDRLDLQGSTASKDAVEILDLAQPAGSNAILGGQVTISISAQGLGLEVER